MADEPSITRWSFQDFKMFYDIKFGRKKESIPKDAATNGQQTTGQASCNGNSANATSNRSGHPQSTSELSIYEQYRQAKENSTPNGVTLSDAEKPAIFDLANKGSFWICLLGIQIAAIVPRFTIKMFMQHCKPSDIQIAREAEKFGNAMESRGQEIEMTPPRR